MNEEQNVEVELTEREKMEAKYVRQLDFVDIENMSTPINVIGSGGIGSWTVLMLAKMGFNNITVHDFDKVEIHNVASQFFKEDQLDEWKVLALKKNVLEQTGVKIKTEIDRIKQSRVNSGIVVIAIDSMEGRHQLERMLSDNCDLDTYIIDGRMSGLQLEVHSCYVDDYKHTLEPAGEVLHEPCTGRAISFNCGIIAGIIANRVRVYADTKNKDELAPTEFRMMFNGDEVSTITNNDLSTEFTKKRDELEDSQQE